ELELEQALVRQALEQAQAPAREARARVRVLLAPGLAPEAPAAAAAGNPGKPGSSARLLVGSTTSGKRFRRGQAALRRRCPLRRL
ncbi:MAG: hypothetical protein WBF03_15230, partial [Xanthobacteraceae bacterium]